MGALRRYAPWMFVPLIMSSVMICGYALGEALADKNNQRVKERQKVNSNLFNSKKIDLACLMNTSLYHFSNTYSYRKTARTNDE